ncbi:MAG TPA: glycosyltransferase family 2 protein [Thermoanaerobaculia bacterium]|nr:glycosyltransferase family 2 protein [Thermoanaerobaculia bacterium]
MTQSAALTGLVLTFNEEKNIAACVESLLPLAKSIFIVDSGSTDRTVAIADQLGARVVHHPFETHARQWRWGLDNLPIESEWVLALDADQRLSSQLQQEISAFIEKNPRANGAYLRRRQMFRGAPIRFGGYGSKRLLKLFRRAAVHIDVDEYVDHHFAVAGPTVVLKHFMIEENRNEDDIGVWISKHNRYAMLQAREEIDRVPPRGKLFGSADDRVRWLKRMWSRQPLYVRPFLYFFYRYFIRLGILDGRQGLVFHFMQALWYRLLVDVNIAQLRGQQAGDREPLST